MIQKVSETEKYNTQIGKTFERDSVSKNAINSFTKTLIASVNSLIKKGSSIDECASKFNLKVEDLKGILSEEKAEGNIKLACSCENNEQNKSEDSNILNEAMDAYNSLHSKTAKQIPDIPSSKRVLGNKISEYGESSKFIGCENNNTIFNPGNIESLLKVKDNGEKIKEENERIAKIRSEAKMIGRNFEIDADSLINNLNNVKTSHVDEKLDYNKKLPQKGISIFDSGDFDRIPEKTAGEIRREEIKAEKNKEKDRSWVESGSKALKSSDLVKNFINSIIKE